MMAGLYLPQFCHHSEELGMASESQVPILRECNSFAQDRKCLFLLAVCFLTSGHLAYSLEISLNFMIKG
jgi:hypothetical protein